MSKLFFYYSAMNAGKSTSLLQASFNYRERGFETILFTYSKDNRNYGVNDSKTDENLYVSSRIGLSEKAIGFNNQTNFVQEVQNFIKNNNGNSKIGAIFVDEAQFLTEQQVKDLAFIVDEMDFPVLTYGLRTDFLGNVFEGSKWLLAWADELHEMKTICSTGKKATFVLRLDENGNPVKSGDQEVIGGNDQYISVSRKMHRNALKS